MQSSKTSWIEIGYQLFAKNGPQSLKIEPMSKLICVNKSSFYHYFADLDLFIDDLLQHHLNQSAIIAQKEQQIQNIHPQLINMLIEHQTDLLFNRQLRFNKHIHRFAKAIAKSDEIIGEYFIQIWVRELSLSLQPPQLKAIFSLAIENFYLQINEVNLNQQWLSEYFNNLKSTIKLMQMGQH